MSVLVSLVGFGVRTVIYHHDTPASSPEDQIRAIVQAEAKDWNDSNFAFRPDLECAALEKGDQAQQADARKARDLYGTATFSVADIQVNGEKASAQVTITPDKSSEQAINSSAQFVKEGGHWLDCTPASDSSDGTGS